MTVQVRPYTDDLWRENLTRMPPRSAAKYKRELATLNISKDFELHMWSFGAGGGLPTHVATYIGPGNCFTSPDSPFCLYSDDNGEYLAAGSEDSTVHVWNREHSHSFVLEGHTDSVNCVGWQPGVAGILASCSDDNFVLVWSS